MKKVVRLTESDLTRIVRRVLNEQNMPQIPTEIMSCAGVEKVTTIPVCMQIITALMNKQLPDPLTMGLCGVEVAKMAPEFMTDGYKCIQEKVKKEPISYQK